MFAGLISFPVLTRLLPVEQYGLMSLVATTLTFLVAFGKLGLQHSAIRFYSDTLGENPSFSFKQYSSTVILGGSCVALVLTLFWIVINLLLPDEFWGSPQLRDLFLITALAIFIRVIISLFNNILSAQEKSGFVSLFQVLYRYAALLLIILLLVFVSPSVFNVFYAQLIVDVMAVVLLYILLVKRLSIEVKSVSWPLLKKMMLFGLPMFGFELAGTVLSIGDRYVIQWQLGAAAVGVYAANYNLCEYAKNVVTGAIGLSVLPMYLRIVAEEGDQAAHRFIVKSLHIYALISFPLVAVVIGVGEDLVTLLASDRYVDGTVVIPYVMLGMTFQGAMVLLAPGLFIKKQSFIMMWLVAATALLNILLNLLLIPFMGIEGAGIATLISFVVYGLASYKLAHRFFPLTLPLYAIARTAAVATGVYMMLSLLTFDGIFWSIFFKSLIGFSSFALVILLVDQEARCMFRQGSKKIAERLF